MIAVLVLGALAPLAAQAQQERGDWSGAWDSRWRTGGAVIFMQQTGTRVQGTYPALGGTIEGRADGRVLTGTWRDPGGSGSFTFAMAPDGRTFMGRFGTGEWWTAERRDPRSLRTVAATDGTRAADALHTLLMAGNEARGGRSDRIGPALELLDFSHYEGDLTPGQRLEKGMRLFRVLDQLTFRIWDVRPP
ncbi:MAG: hypothetical protein ACOCYE_13570, partial [Pseudomonadota bacterium]